jgi:fluoride exporter
MSALTTGLLVCLAGGVGAALRLVLDGLMRGWVRVPYPVATTVINCSGSLLLGVLTGITVHHLLPPGWQLIAGTGLLGGYTTFSTASFETVRLLEERRALAATINAFGMLLAGTALAALGFVVGRALT